MSLKCSYKLARVRPARSLSAATSARGSPARRPHASSHRECGCARPYPGPPRVSLNLLVDVKELQAESKAVTRVDAASADENAVDRESVLRCEVVDDPSAITEGEARVLP